MQVVQERWEHREKERYYSILLSPDLFGQWVVTRVWGGINQATGRITHVPCTSYEEGLSMVAKIAKIRLQHGYLLCAAK